MGWPRWSLAFERRREQVDRRPVQTHGSGGSCYGAAMIGPATPLVLGSASPRRAEILGTLGVSFRVVVAQVDETSAAEEFPEDYIQRIVNAKASALGEVLAAQTWGASLVADTVVTLDQQILGKPIDAEDAASMLRRLQGRTHAVMTRYRIDTLGGASLSRTVSTAVTFRRLAADEVTAYAASGEGFDKAGGYAIQGKAAAFVESLQGSYTGVVGLPACQLIVDLRELGVLKHSGMAF